MARVRLHFPPDERPRRLLIVLPLLVGLAGVALGCLSPRQLGLDVHAQVKVLPLIACATLSFGPMLGFLFWHVSPWRRFRSRRAKLTADGFRVWTLLRGIRSFRWLDFHSIFLLPTPEAQFALCTPRDGRATWILEISGETGAAFPAGLDERAAGGVASAGGPGQAASDLVFTYQPLTTGRVDAWVLSGVAVWLVFLYSSYVVASESYYGCLLLPAFPIHAIVSLGFLVTFLAHHPTCATLRISRQERSFLVPHRKVLLQYPVDPSMIRGRTEMDDPSGTPSRRFALPDGSLPPHTQLRIIEALLAPESSVERVVAQKIDVDVAPELDTAARASREKEQENTE